MKGGDRVRVLPGGTSFSNRLGVITGPADVAGEKGWLVLLDGEAGALRFGESKLEGSDR